MADQLLVPIYTTTNNKNNDHFVDIDHNDDVPLLPTNNEITTNDNTNHKNISLLMYAVYVAVFFAIFCVIGIVIGVLTKK